MEEHTLEKEILPFPVEIWREVMRWVAELIAKGMRFVFLSLGPAAAHPPQPGPGYHLRFNSIVRNILMDIC